jgi:hypothetical protein
MKSEHLARSPPLVTCRWAALIGAGHVDAQLPQPVHHRPCTRPLLTRSFCIPHQVFLCFLIAAKDDNSPVGIPHRST